MALSVYQNQLSFDLIIPGWESTFHLYPGEYVGREYYDKLVPTLTDVTSENIPVASIKYIYPGSTDAPSGGSGGIDVISGIDPVQVSTLNGYSTISLRPLTSADFEASSVVSGINGLTDAVTIVGEAGIDVSTNVGTNTISLTNTQLGLVATYADPPLYLTLGEGNASLEGAVEITYANSGGAVALQPHITSDDPPIYPPVTTYQVGFAALEGLHLKYTGAYTDTSSGKVITLKDELDAINFSVGTDGSLVSLSDISTAEKVSSTKLDVYTSGVLDAVTGDIVYGDSIFSVSASGDLFRTDLPTSFYNTVSIGEASSIYSGEYGNLTGTQTELTPGSLITLFKEGQNNAPLINLNTDQISPNITANILQYFDGEGTSLVKIYDDGVIDAKTVNAGVVNATTVNAETIYTNSFLAVGPTTVNVTTSGPNVIMADCSTSVNPISVVVQLPDLNTFDKSLTITVIKIDNSNYTVSIVNGLNSTINGSTAAIELVDQYETITLVSNGIKWYKIGAM
jgi:hypothetical protein